MSVRQTRLEEAILERALYSDAAAAIGATIGLLDQTQQDARMGLTTEYRRLEPSYQRHSTTAPQGHAATINAASAFDVVMPFNGAVYTVFNYSMLTLNGSVVDASLVNAQRCSFINVAGAGGTAQSAASATLSFTGPNITFPSSSTTIPAGVCNEQSLVMVGDPTTSPRVPSPILSKYLLLLAARRAVLSETQFASLARQLRALLSDLEEPSTLDNARSVGSFRGLVKFLSERRPSHPSLSISKHGQFVASWSPKRRAELSLSFADAEGGSWYALSLDDQLNDEGTFLTSTFNMPAPFGSWIMQ